MSCSQRTATQLTARKCTLSTPLFHELFSAQRVIASPSSKHHSIAIQEHRSIITMSSALAKVARPKAEIRLMQATKEFEADLSDEQKKSFLTDISQTCLSPPNIHDVMRLTAEIDRRISGTFSGRRGLGPRLTNILQAVQQFAALGDIIIGGSQNMIACGL